MVTFIADSKVDYGKYGFLVLRVSHAQRSAHRTASRAVPAFHTDPKNQPVHIHSAIDRWPLDQALEEARRYRQRGDLSTKRVDWLREWAAKHPAGSFRVNQ